MTKAIHLELRYPNLAITDYNVTSPKSQEYNCFAWAAGDQERWWQPTPEDEFYWVEGEKYGKVGQVLKIPLSE